MGKLVTIEVFLACLFILRHLVPWVYLVSTEVRLYPSLVVFGLWLAAHFARMGDAGSFLTGLRSRVGRLILVWTLVLMVDYLRVGGGSVAWERLFSMVYVLAFYLVVGMYGRDGRPVFRWLLTATTVIAGVHAAYSIPNLLAQPGAARLMMQMPAGEAKNYLASLGIGGYDTYLGLAIVLPLLWAYGLSTRRGLNGTVLVVCCVAILVSILLSTFTAASELAVVGSAVVLMAYWVTARGSGGIVRVAVVSCVLALVMVKLGPVVLESEQFSFVYRKTERIAFGSAEAGVVAGDETGRAALALGSLRIWTQNPVFGSGSFNTISGAQVGFGGHSTWVDALAQYGLLGAGCLFSLLFAIRAHARRIERVPGAGLLKTGATVSWVMYVLAGLVNNVHAMPLIDYFVFFCVVGAAENAHWLVGTREARAVMVKPRRVWGRASSGDLHGLAGRPVVQG